MEPEDRSGSRLFLFGVAGVRRGDFRGRTDWTLVAEDVAEECPKRQRTAAQHRLEMLEEELQTKADRMHVSWCCGCHREIGKLAQLFADGQLRAGARLKLQAAGSAERDDF